VRLDERARHRAAISSEIHRDLPREGPGDAASTRRAWKSTGLSSAARILDVGCGPGAQTIDLATASGARIVALDNHREYLEQCRGRMTAIDAGDRVALVQASMAHMPFTDGSFDAVWSEGAIYILGFQRALREWRPLLRAGGYVAASHLCWLQATTPDEPQQFWARAFPEMRGLDENASLAGDAGFDLIERFVLPESAWWDTYYDPIETRLASLRGRYAGDREALAVIADSEEQIQLYRRYAEYYGYVFFVLRMSADPGGGQV
jgi:ubiquinone/menaquinone biosynthesis C-methylase UbiE